MCFPLLPRLLHLPCRLAVLCLAALLFPRSVRAEDPAPTYEVETHKDVAYYEGDNADPVKHKLDLYLPKGLKDFPVLFFVHGGAWQMGDKAKDFGTYITLGKTFAKAGIGTVVTNYRLSPGVKHPEHIKDVARASPGRTRTSPSTAAGPTAFSSAATPPAGISSRCWPPTNSI